MRLTYDRTLNAFTVYLILTIKEMALDSCVRGDALALDTRIGLTFDGDDDILITAQFIDERYPFKPLLSQRTEQRYAQVDLLTKMQQPSVFQHISAMPMPENQFAFGGEVPNMVDIFLMHYAALNNVELRALRQVFNQYEPYQKTRTALGNDWY